MEKSGIEVQGQQKRKLIVKKIEIGPSLAKGGVDSVGVTCESSANANGCNPVAEGGCDW
jgi:hypothetical protein